MIDGKALCYGTFNVVEVKTSLEFARTEVCLNCDNRMRDRGRELRKTTTQVKRSRSKTPDYTPRYKFKE